MRLRGASALYDAGDVLPGRGTGSTVYATSGGFKRANPSCR